MHFPSRLIAATFLLLLTAESPASPAEARRIQQSWQLATERWSQETRAATTTEARAAALAKRPDIISHTRDMWRAIGSALDQEWTLEYGAWFLQVAPGLRETRADGSTVPFFSAEVDALFKAIESHHLKSPQLMPVCMALAGNLDPRALGLLEKIQVSNPDSKIQGVAALASALILKNLSDEPELMRKRLTFLRKAIIDSSEVDFGGTTVAKLAENELYIIRFLTKGRVAPDLSGIDSASRPIKLSDFSGKVVVLMFWSSTMDEAERVIEITSEMKRKFQGRPLEVLGVNLDPLEKLRSMEAGGTVNWRNFSDPANQLAAEYRVSALPFVLVLDGTRKIQFAGPPGSFVELTAEALLSEMAPASE